MSLTTDDRAVLDDELAVDTDAFAGLLARLNDQSVRPGKHFDAYVDVPWDEHPIDPADPRWELGAADALGATAWYQSQPQEVRARIGLHMIAGKMQVGYFFEGVLKRGCSSTPPRWQPGHLSCATCTTRSSKRRSTP